jgi:hypothetical protein
MYLRRCYRKKDGKRHAYWALVESHRTERGPRQRVVAWLGAMDERGRLGVKRCAERSAAQQGCLLRDTRPEWVEVDVKRVQVSRKFGGPWLGLELGVRREATVASDRLRLLLRREKRWWGAPTRGGLDSRLLQMDRTPLQMGGGTLGEAASARPNLGAELPDNPSDAVILNSGPAPNEQLTKSPFQRLRFMPVPT